MLPPDCEAFLRFVQERDPVVVVEKDSDSPEVTPLLSPCQPGHVLSLWNPRLLPSLERKHIKKSTKGPYYRIDAALPVPELFLPRQQEWDGAPALTQGRVYSSFDHPSEELSRWFNAIARWIRQNFTKNPVKPIGGYVGPAALKWHEEGGLLLPMVRPPVTPEWRDLLHVQWPGNRSTIGTNSKPKKS